MNARDGGLGHVAPETLGGTWNRRPLCVTKSGILGYSRDALGFSRALWKIPPWGCGPRGMSDAI